MACEGCGERWDACRCGGDVLSEDMAWGFHVVSIEDEEQPDDQ